MDRNYALRAEKPINEDRSKGIKGKFSYHSSFLSAVFKAFKLRKLGYIDFQISKL